MKLTHNKMHNDEFITYSGPFSMRVISSMAKYLTETIHAAEVSKMKLYRVFIELSQNVALYSANRYTNYEGLSIGVGSFTVLNCNDYIECKTTNLIVSSHQQILSHNCSQINALPEWELKKQKDKLRRETPLSDTGAHIGLITIALYSGNPLEFVFQSNGNEDHLYFSIAAHIPKTINTKHNEKKSI